MDPRCREHQVRPQAAMILCPRPGVNDDTCPSKPAHRSQAGIPQQGPPACTYIDNTSYVDTTVRKPARIVQRVAIASAPAHPTTACAPPADSRLCRHDRRDCARHRDRPCAATNCHRRGAPEDSSPVPSTVIPCAAAPMASARSARDTRVAGRAMPGPERAGQNSRRWSRWVHFSRSVDRSPVQSRAPLSIQRRSL